MVSKLNAVHKKVPVLIHGKKVILEYIEETWKQVPLLPQNPYDRATARFLANLSDEKLFWEAWMAMCSQGDEKERALKQAMEAMKKIEEELNGKKASKFFGGESIGYLDLVMGPFSTSLPWKTIHEDFLKKLQERILQIE